jgi:hypothetical protein
VAIGGRGAGGSTMTIKFRGGLKRAKPEKVASRIFTALADKRKREKKNDDQIRGVW